ncbi:hypothetical protein ACTFIU_003752 [Dictyostelium citrinum]
MPISDNVHLPALTFHPDYHTFRTPFYTIPHKKFDQFAFCRILEARSLIRMMQQMLEEGLLVSIELPSERRSIGYSRSLRQLSRTTMLTSLLSRRESMIL